MKLFFDRHSIIILLLTVFLNSMSWGQDYTVSMKRYTVNDGLSSRSINKIIQDNDGYLWLSTNDGLNRFDGYGFTQLFPDQGIQDIVLAQSKLWVLTTSQQLWTLDVETLDTTHISIPQNLDFLKIRTWKDKLLLANENVLYLFSPSNPYELTEVFSVLDLPNKKEHFSTTKLHFIIVDDEEAHIWLGLGGSQIRQINIHGEVLNIYDHYSEAGNRIFSKDQGGDLWLNYDPLFRKRKADSVFRAVTLPQTETKYEVKPSYHSSLLMAQPSKSTQVVTPKTVVRIEQKNNEWYYLLSSKTSNIHLWNPKKEELFTFSFEELSRPKLTFVDRNETLWLATIEGLISIHIEKKPITQYLKNDPLIKGASASMRGLFQDETGTVWMNSYHGIFQLKPTGEFQEWEYADLEFSKGVVLKKEKNHSGFNYYTSLSEKDNFWFTSDSFGCFRYDRQKNKLARISMEDKGWLFFYAIKRGYQGRLWVGGRGGVFEINEELQKLEPIVVSDTTYTANYTVFDLLLVDTITWVASDHGIYKFNLPKNKFLGHLGVKQGLSHDFVLALYQDKQNIIWAGTRGGGLNRINPLTGDIQSFTKQSHGFSDDFICSIVAENDTILWLGSFNGLMRFNKYSHEVTSFFERNGLTDQEFNHTSAFKAKDGRLFFGGVRGMNAFYPNELVEEASTYKVLLNKLTIYNQKEKAFKEITSTFLKEEKLVLSPKIDFVDITFSMNDFSIPDKHNYAYKLEGIDDNWIELGSQHQLRLAKPQVGSYTLLIKGRASNGIWSDRLLKIPILSKAPYYQHPVFILVMILILGLCIYLFVRIRTIRLKQAKEKLEGVVADRTKELLVEKQKVEAQASRLKVLDQTKSRFFANISHELRTPLTLILGQLNYLSEQDQPLSLDTVKEELNITEQNAKQLLVLIEEIMDLSKLEAGKLSLQNQTTQLYTLFMQMVETYQAITRQKNILLHWDFQLSKHNPIIIDRNKFKKVLHNLLSNAFKFTPEGGEVFVRIAERIEKGKTLMEVSVTDTGRGIHPNDLPHVFNRFYQSEQADAPTEGGTGIGLALVKELIGLMDGEVLVESELEKGTTFQFYLPLIYADDTYLEVSKSTEQPLVFPIEESLEIDSSEIPDPPYKPTILIVEDHQQMRQFLKKSLKEFYQIKEAQDGLEALEVLAKTEVDLVLSDLMMPRMDGYQLLEHLKADMKTGFLPTIMLTARADVEDKLKALAIGVNEYMLKPFHPTELRVRIKNLIHFSLERKKWLAEMHSYAAYQDQQSPNQELINLAKKDIINHLSDSNYGVIHLAEATALSQRSLARKLKAATGMSPLQFINEIRLQEARKLLELGIKSTVAEVMYQVGFRAGGHFSRNFQKRFGKNPSEILETSR